jgi:hypothetical protein
MRWSVRTGPRCIDAPAEPAPLPRRAQAESTDWVELARRMSIPDDHAIRQVVDLAMGANAEERHPPRR